MTHLKNDGKEEEAFQTQQFKLHLHKSHFKSLIIEGKTISS